MIARAALVSLTLLLAWSGRDARADEAPAWMRVPSGAATHGRNVPASWLLMEQNVTVSEDGRIILTERGAVRLFSKEARSLASAGCVYRTDGGKVQQIRAWLVRPSGEVMTLGKKHVIDVSAASNDVYNEVRLRAIGAIDDAEPGAVFGYEWTVEDRSVFTQLDWSFQDRLPVAVSRFSLQLPAGWRAESVTFNHAPVAPTVAGLTQTWELRDLPLVEDEPASPPITDLVPRLAVSWFPPAGARSAVRSFANWTEVSSWLAELNDPQSEPGAALSAKARELVAGAGSELERVRAIGRFAQGVNYVSIQTGIGRGGGYRPHTADEVFAKSYGDCKDKANLMRAMLKSVGIAAWPVAIYAGDPGFVREEWPSPQQFNHCIVAIKVGEQTAAPTVVEYQALGRLLIFDPTDPETPLGDLPELEQGSRALIVAGDKGALLRMPVTPPDSNRLEREVDVSLSEDGAITVQVRERSAGTPAVAERRLQAGRSHVDYTGLIERWVAQGATAAVVSKVAPTDDWIHGRFALDVDFTAPGYGRLIQNRLMAFKPAVVSRREGAFLTEPTRTLPVVLDPGAYRETVRVTLPESFEVDELPDPVKLETDFGRYEAVCEVSGRELHFRRSLRIGGGVIPVARYADLRGFYEKMRSAEQASVVLTRR